MAQLSFLNRGGGTPTVGGYAAIPGSTLATAPPMGSAPSAYGQFTSGLGDVTRGRVSLLMLDSLILLLVVFYVWTHRAQGGG